MAALPFGAIRSRGITFENTAPFFEARNLLSVFTSRTERPDYLACESPDDVLCYGPGPGPVSGELKPELVFNTAVGGPGDKLHPNRLGYLTMGAADISFVKVATNLVRNDPRYFAGRPFGF
jgi:hypothetical protein